LKTNPKTGELTLESGLVLSPLLTRSVFLSSPNGARAKRIVDNAPWRSFRFEENEESLAVIVFFKGETLESVQITVTGPELGTSWENWSEEKELKRKRANDQWLIGKGLVPDKIYSWGTVWSGYDRKDGSSSIIIRYQNGSQ
jgi:hypothetical protein